MLVFYIFGFYMILLILTVIVLLMLYCFDFMPWILFFHCRAKSTFILKLKFIDLVAATFISRMQNNSSFTYIKDLLNKNNHILEKIRKKFNIYSNFSLL